MVGPRYRILEHTKIKKGMTLLMKMKATRRIMSPYGVFAEVGESIDYENGIATNQHNTSMALTFEERVNYSRRLNLFERLALRCKQKEMT